jgi:prepilin-type N-terminal cleavage/methylation domain-containing protein
MSGKMRSRAAFTLVELLIAISLVVMILGAAGLAVKAAADAAAYGNHKGRSLTQATMALSWLTTDLRRASEIQIESSRSVRLWLASGEERHYWWSGTDGAPLMFSSPANPAGNVLVPSVAAFSLSAVNAYSQVAGGVVAVSVQVVLEARDGDTTTRLETCVRPRRNIM